MAYISKDEFIQSFSNWIHYEYGYQDQKMHYALSIAFARGILDGEQLALLMEIYRESK